MSAAVFKPEIALPKSELRLLGPLSLAIDGRELHQLPRKADALLALLALQPGRPMAPRNGCRFSLDKPRSGAGAAQPAPDAACATPQFARGDPAGPRREHCVSRPAVEHLSLADER